MPAMHLTRVDLPAPLSPTRAITSPLDTWKSTPFSACTAPKLLWTSRSSSSGAAPSLTEISPPPSFDGLEGAPPAPAPPAMPFQALLDSVLLAVRGVLAGADLLLRQ